MQFLLVPISCWPPLAMHSTPRRRPMFALPPRTSWPWKRSASCALSRAAGRRAHAPPSAAGCRVQGPSNAAGGRPRRRPPRARSTQRHRLLHASSAQRRQRAPTPPVAARAVSSIWEGILARAGGDKAVLPARTSDPHRRRLPASACYNATSRRSVLGARAPLVDERGDDQASSTRSRGGFCKSDVHDDGSRRAVVLALKQSSLI